MRQGLARAAVALICVVAFSACSTLPRSGPVHTSEPRLPAPAEADFFAGGPADGADPRQIVEGFLNAQTAGYAAEGFAVAREFLTDQAAAQWDPTARVHVYRDGTGSQTTQDEDGSILVRAQVAGELDAVGRYTENAPGTETQLRFTLVRDLDGEWRIASLEDGVLLSTYVFSIVFSSQPLYFLTADRTALLPDLRWFPRESLPGTLLEALLAGPDEQLTGVAVSEIPEGTDVLAPQVEITDGILTLEMSDQLAALPEPQRTLAGVQLERTMFSVATVREVVISSGGEELQLDPSRAALSSYPLGSGTPVAMALSDGGLVRLGESGPTPVLSAAQLGATDPTDLAVSYDGSRVAVLDEGKRLILAYPASQGSSVAASSETMTPPSFDRYDWVWTADETGTLRAISPQGGMRVIDAPGLEGRRISRLAVSREGSRLVVVSLRDGETLVEIYGIQRDGADQPVALGTRVGRLGAELIEVADVAWVEDVMIAVLGRSDPTSAQPTVHLVQVGGTGSTLPLVEKATSLTAARGPRSLIVDTSDGELWVRLGAGWRATSQSDVVSPAYPG